MLFYPRIPNLSYSNIYPHVQTYTAALSKVIRAEVMRRMPWALSTEY